MAFAFDRLYVDEKERALFFLADCPPLGRTYSVGRRSTLRVERSSMTVLESIDKDLEWLPIQKLAEVSRYVHEPGESAEEEHPSETALSSEEALAD